MLYNQRFQGIEVRTGDLLATRDGTRHLPGQYWRMVGGLIPGDVDHIVVYVGPGTRCVEAGATGKVIAFEPDPEWDGEAMHPLRGFVDTLYGAAFPLAGRGLSPEQEAEIRVAVAEYCLLQAELAKPYNLNFFDPETEDAFYCSQLAYKAYQPHGINLNTGAGMIDFPLTRGIVFPQEVFSGCEHVRV